MNVFCSDQCHFLFTDVSNEETLKGNLFRYLGLGTVLHWWDTEKEKSAIIPTLILTREWSMY